MEKEKTMNNKDLVQSNFKILIPYNYILYATLFCFCWAVASLFYFHSILDKTNSHISSMESKFEELEKTIHKVNQKNEELNATIIKLKSENDSLLVKIDNLQTNILDTSTSTLLSESNIKFAIIFGSVVLGTIGIYYVGNFVLAKFCKSSIGLLIGGVDSPLKSLGSKLGFHIDNKDVYTFIDSTNRHYIVNIDHNTPSLSSLQVKSQDQFVDIGSYISELLENATLVSVNTVDIATQTVVVPDLAPVAAAAINNAQIVQGANLETTLNVIDVLSKSLG